MKDIRSWAKSFVWRFIGIWLLGLITWLVTHSWAKTTVITVSFHLLRVLMYYFHERAWENVPRRYDKVIFNIFLILTIASFILLLVLN